jgi:DNA-binding CsgD family transcriptional regulator
MSATRTTTKSATRERELQRRFAEFAADASELLAVDVTPAASGELQHQLAVTAIAEVGAGIAAALRAGGDTGEPIALAALAVRGAELDRDLRDHDLQRRKRALAAVEAALGRLRYVGSSSELAEAVCGEVVRSCDFTRAMLSRVADITWMPWMAFFSYRDIKPSDEEWMTNRKIPLRNMAIERSVLESGRPAFVADTTDEPLAGLLQATRTTSYAVAPIVVEGNVIGFLHADRYRSARAVDDVDCHILGVFADGFGRIYERAVLLERLQKERDHVRDTLKAAETIMDNLARAEVELVRHANERSTGATASTLALTGDTIAIDELLTPREREVIGLLVTGQTNSAIAERLVISEGTVKSHVKQILRKLGAVNRSEVIARYLGMLSDD